MSAASNERLEFVGDRVLGLLIAEWLAERFPREQEGELGRRLAQLVSQPVLAGVAEAIGLGAALSVAPGEARAGVKRRATVLADGMEAALGALYLDGGLDKARAFVRRAWDDAMMAQSAPPKDAKTGLQEWTQARGLPLPAYTVVSRAGPPHAPVFVISGDGRWDAGHRHGRHQAGGGAGGRRRSAGEAQPVSTRCGYAAIVGAPNAGKSTLLNRLTGEKLSIVTPKAQTTRFRVLGILMRGESQILLVDTPGIFRPRRRLDRAMVAAAWTGAQDADLVLLLADAKAGATEAVRAIAARLKDAGRRAWLVLNKIDLVARAEAAAADRRADRARAVRGNVHGQRRDGRRAGPAR